MATRIIKTQVTGTSTQKFTLSAWLKKASNTANNDQVIYDSYADGNNRITLYFRGNNGNRLNLFCFLSGSTVCEIETTRKFRDVNSWYNIVLKVDTTQANVSHRVRIYVNGVEETALTISTYPSQNANLPMGTSSYQHAFGFYSGGGSSAFQGSMSHLHFIDGEDRDASYFGSTDANGVWKIKTSVSGVNYGNNGFFILKDGNSLTDQSGKGNNFTLSTGTLTKTEDNPSNVFATANPIDNYYQNFSFTNGNTAFTTHSSSNTSAPTKSTIGVNSGKYYWEVKCVGVNTGSFTYATIGITSRDITTNAQGNHLGSKNEDYAYYSYNGHILNNAGTSNTGNAYGNTYTAGDIIGVALDLDNNKLYFSKNGTWQNSGVPTSGSTGTGAVSISLPTANNGKGNYFTGVGDYHFSPIYSFAMNFGNGYFGTTAVSSAGANASGNGIFEYDVPTGYTALSTKGLNL